jgi:hypothetical protein
MGENELFYPMPSGILENGAMVMVKRVASTVGRQHKPEQTVDV